MVCFRSLSLLPLTVLVCIGLLSACSGPLPRAEAPEPVPALPDVPGEVGPPTIELAYPKPGAAQPDADSTFLFGTVGTGTARLIINDIRVPVAPNGAFLAYLPVPSDGRYRLRATTGEQTDRMTFAYGQAVTVDDVRPLPRARVGTVISGRDTLDAASQIVAGRDAPGGNRRWFFPRGTRLPITGELPTHYRVQLTPYDTAWVHKNTTQLGPPLGAAEQRAGAVRVEPAQDWVDVRIPVHYAPFNIQSETGRVGITIYGRQVPNVAPTLSPNALVAGVGWRTEAGQRARLDLDLERPLWGFKAFYDTTGALVVRLRRPPQLDPAAPLRGLRVLVDPGHPPAGTLGPTGLLEPEANLAIALRVRDQLTARGAEVVMTRTTAAPPENATWAPDDLWARADMAIRENVDVLISIHNNAFPDGTNPFENVGSEVYYFHPFAQGLAQSLVDEIAGVTGLPNLGAKQRSLALVRPTWMPAVLTESLFMMFPQQEAALKNPAYVNRLAAAHVRGLEAFVRERLEPGS
jgi:N-acetylmuramoyl-L-alanine amidase